jgi:replicative DNA helicase
MIYPVSTFDEATELQVLSYLILEDDSNFFNLSEKDFYNNIHRKIFKEVLANHKPNYDKLLELGLSDNSRNFLYECLNTHSAMERNCLNLRQMTKARKSFYESQKNIENLNKATLSSLPNLVGGVDVSSRTYTPPEMREKLKNEEIALPIKFDPDVFCEALEFFNTGWIGVIGASTGVGKTSTVIQIGRSIAKYEGSILMTFSLEMVLKDYLERCLSIAYYSSPDTNWSGWQELRRCLTMETLMQHGIVENEIINDQPNITISQMTNEIKKKQDAGFDIKTVIVDHFHIIGSEPGSNGATENQSQDKKIEDLSAMAKKLNVRVLLACQTKKASGDNRTEEPYDSDIRGTKKIMEQADLALLLWREKDNNDVVNYKVAKRRGGIGVGTKGQIGIRGTFLHNEMGYNNPNNY